MLIAYCTPAELQWQRELLVHTACQVVVGCQEELWPWAVPAAVAIVVAMEVGVGKELTSIRNV